jgi:O-antigen ligase
MPLFPPPRPPGSAVSGWAGKVLLAFGILVFSIIAGSQVVDPDPRVLQVVAAGAVVFLAFRATSISALAFAVLLLPFPKATSYGNTNVALTLLIFLVWIFRVSTKREAPPVRTSVDVAILGLVMAYAVSFYEVEPVHFAQAWSLFLNFLSYVLILFLAVNIIKTPKDVQKVLAMQLLSCVMLCVLAVYEQGHPGATIIPGWVTLGASEGMTDSIRVGSTFLDYELFGEYCALNLFLQMFLFTRATSNTRRWVLVGIILLTFYCLFSTVTRGAIISFMVGSIYLIWLSRHRLNFVKLVTILSLSVGLIAGADFVVANFTNSDSVLERLFATKLENGVPDTRAGAWKMAVENIADKPLIGHGPYYSARRGVEVQWWPHNVYLFYGYIVGLVGLAFFLWILWELWRITRPRSLSLGHGTYMQGASLLARVLLFTFIVDQIKIDYLRNPRYSTFVWMLFGVLYAVGRVARDEDAKAKLGLAPAAEPVSGPAHPGAVRMGIARRPAVQRVAASPAVPNR